MQHTNTPTTELLTAVIPAAGVGSRMLPLSSAVPKELLPVAGVPALQWVLDEAVAAGVRRVVIVSSRDKTALERYVERLAWSRDQMHKQGRTDIATRLDAAAQLQFDIAYQDEPLGLGHAVGCAAPLLIGSSRCVVLLPDEVLLGPGTLRALLDAAAATPSGAAVALREVPATDTHRYGVVAPTSTVLRTVGVATPAYDSVRFSDVVEKPAPGTAPSRLAVIGRYLLPIGIFEDIEQLRPSVGGELQLTDALQAFAHRSGDISGIVDTTVRFDVGSPHGLHAANMALYQD
jgi:UTP--glucose-1-phosphate uridylyltransferase